MVLLVTAELANLGKIRRFVEESAQRLSVDVRTSYALAHAVDECVTNIIEHGYNGQPGPIEIKIERMNETLLIELRDQAPPFDPTGVPPPDLTQPFEKREPGGLGVYLARQMVDEMRHRALPGGGNALTLIKHLQATSS
jgi:anti-sigma regulatory factor (Ser/Thr protein kinase)